MRLSKHYLFMEALVRRVHPDDVESASIHEEFYRMQAGLSGEMKLHRALADYAFPTDYALCYNFECLNTRGFSHQIDALLFTPHFIVIFEVKQISGTLSYKPQLHQFSRTNEHGHTENFHNPFDQAYRHKRFIEQILAQHQLQVPVIELVVIANYRASLDTSLADMPILHISGLPLFLDKLYGQYPSTKLQPQTIQALFTTNSYMLPARRSLAQTRIRVGVLCPTCRYEHTMTFKHGAWYCFSCQTQTKNALHVALHDYRTLISPRISNKEFRQFFGVTSKFAASRLLTQLGLLAYGEKKGRYYEIPENIYYEDFDARRVLDRRGFVNW